MNNDEVFKNSRRRFSWFGITWITSGSISAMIESRDTLTQTWWLWIYTVEFFFFSPTMIKSARIKWMYTEVGSLEVVLQYCLGNWSLSHKLNWTEYMYIVICSEKLFPLFAFIGASLKRKILNSEVMMQSEMNATSLDFYILLGQLASLPWRSVVYYLSWDIRKQHNIGEITWPGEFSVSADWSKIGRLQGGHA